jgi:uncharacterized protein (TIGR03086 family)
VVDAVALELLRAGVAAFEHHLASVADGQWRSPTPCDEWDVRDLVEHVTAGNRMAVGLLAPHRVSEPETSAADSSRDPVEAFGRSVVHQDEAFGAADPHDPVAHPAGRISAHEFAIYRCGDIVVHAWDLARAIGVDDALDPGLVEQVLVPYAGWVRTLDRTGVFSDPASLGVPGDRRQDELLRELGRRP